MNIIVNGGTRGIGREIALKLSDNTANRILITGRNVKELEKLSLIPKSGNIVTCRIDLQSFDDHSSTFREIISSQFKNIDILINIAGLLIRKDFMETTYEEAGQMMGTNFLGIAALIRAAKPYMLPGAHIVNISSMGGYQGSRKYRGLSYYSASKAALSCLSECLAMEFREFGIIVNCLALGSAQTEMFKEAFPDHMASVTAGEMADYVIDFAIKGSKFFNGKIIPVALDNP